MNQQNGLSSLEIFQLLYKKRKASKHDLSKNLLVDDNNLRSI